MLVARILPAKNNNDTETTSSSSNSASNTPSTTASTTASKSFLSCSLILWIKESSYSIYSVSCERPSVVLHAILVFWPRAYDSFSAAQASVVSGAFYICAMPLCSSAFWQIANSTAQVNMDNYKHTNKMVWRFVKVGLIQWCILASAFFGPDGTPRDTSQLATSLLVLSVTAEILLGTKRDTSFVAPYQPHIIVVGIFSFPLVLLCLWELVGMTVASRNSFGTQNIQGTGAIGGYSNQVRGSANFGWWYGSLSKTITYFTWLCYILIMLSLNFSAHMAKWCTKGVKAPFWLEHILAETHGGRIPVLAEGSKYHFFICKQDGNGPFSGKNLAYGKYLSEGAKESVHRVMEAL